MGEAEIKVGMICNFPPEKASQGYMLDSLMPFVSGVKFIKIGSLNSDADYKINLKSFNLSDSIRDIIKKEKLSLLHVHYIAPFFGRRTLNFNLLPLYDLKIPVVTTIHEVQYNLKSNLRSFSPYSVLKYFVLRFIQYEIVRKSVFVIVFNHLMADFLRSIYPPAKVEVIPEPCEKRYEVQKVSSKKIIFFGVFSPGKDVESLLGAMVYLSGYSLCIVGSLPESVNYRYLEKIKHLIREMGLENRVKLITKDWFSESEKKDFFGRSDVIVLPYSWGPYNSGLIRDACQYGLPMVVTRVGFIWDPVKRYDLGIVVEPHNAKELANAIENVFSKIENYRNNVMSLCLKSDYSQVARSYKSIYYSSLGQAEGV
ncbi:MAG: glycosyltransferase [Candidatus Omnitrophica bacterium]|nr:glycosyltransferase [Candidatus Omnitrophota bacterium]